MDIEYYVEASKAKEQKIVAWGCFARCYFNWATISKNDIVNRAPHLLVQDHTVLQIPLFCNGLEGAV